MSFSEPCAFRISAIAGQPIRTRGRLSWLGRGGQRRRDARGYAGRAGRLAGGPERPRPRRPRPRRPPPRRPATAARLSIRQPRTRPPQACLRRAGMPFRDERPLVSGTPSDPYDSPAPNSPLIPLDSLAPKEPPREPLTACRPLLPPVPTGTNAG